MLACASASAQTPPPFPDAGQLDRQLRESERLQEERDRRAQPKGPALTVPQQQTQDLPTGDAKLNLVSISWGASVYLRPSELEAFASPLMGKEVTFADLQALIDRVNARYRELGQFAARAILPPQTVRDGKLQIELVEARVEGLNIKGNSAVRTSWVERWIPAQDGQVVDTQSLEEALQRWNVASDSRLSADLEPGKGAGGSIVNVQVREPARWSGIVGLANDGNDSTGRVQANGTLRWFSPTGIGDRVSLGLTKSQGVDGASLQYAAPIHPSGTRISLGLSSSRFHIVSGPYVALDISGNSLTRQASLGQPLWARGAWSLDGTLGWSQQRSETFTSGVSPGSNLLRAGSVGLGLLRRTPELELSASVSGQRAKLAPSAGTAVTYTIYNGTLGAQWNLKGGQSFVLRSSWQTTPASVLPATLQYSVGGPTLVRGYAPSTAFGEKGYSATAEYIKTVSSNLAVSVFYDRAAVWGDARTRVSLDSIGSGLEWRGSGSLNPVSAAAYVAYALEPGLAASTGRWRAQLRVGYSF
jgi:hemolysin activation/secretion protein